MRRASHIALVTMTSLLLAVTSIEGYEDNTHQQLSKRALQVAAGNAQGVPPDLVALFVASNGVIKDLGLQVIAGAGAPDIGEDYTIYFIDWDCPVKVTTWPWFAESLNHFGTGLLWGGPAYASFVRFYGDAVDLWNSGNKTDAAFTLGRALHPIEDMAPPLDCLSDVTCGRWMACIAFHWNLGVCG